MRDFATLRELLRPYYLRWIYFQVRPHSRPSFFHDCWRYPVEPLKRLPPPERDKPDLLFLPMTDWHTRMQRTQHLAAAFAQLGHRCILLNPHLGRQFETTPFFDRTPVLGRIAENIFELHVPLPREPVFHHRLLTRDEEQVLASAVLEVLPSHAIQFVSFPLWRGLSRILREQVGFPIVYDCHDLLSGFPRIARSIVAEEISLFREADLVLFSSRDLARRNPCVQDSLLVRNAADANHFRAAHAPRSGAPGVAYVGALESWFDIEAVATAARSLPETRFLIIGQVENPKIWRLRKLRNVEFTGEVPYSELPRLLRNIGVGLIPFLDTELTRATNPIKLYEYFACGIPVVSTALPEVERMGNLVYIASNPADFASAVRNALGEDDPLRRSQRLEIAAREDWQDRARVIAPRLESISKAA